MKCLARIAAVIALTMVPYVTLVRAADLPSEPKIEVQPSDEAAIETYVKGRAILHIIRATFDVEEGDGLARLIKADVDQSREAGVSAADVEQLKIDLLAEGSYFIVGLKYLVLAGFPAWPADKSEATYAADTLAILDPLAAQLHESIDDGADPLPVFLAAQKVYWWTEGSLEPIDWRAAFDKRDALVDAALAAPDDQVAHT